MIIYNTLSKTKETLTPINAGKISMYVCGVTVYDRCHVGHARAYVAFDNVYRYLKFKGYDVTYIQNFTDIDDKIIKRSKEEGVSCKELTETYISAYFDDMDALNISRATEYPRATEFIDEMIELISRLIKNKTAYEQNGHVYFSVESKTDYGKLSKKVLEDLEAGNRVDVSDNKRNPLDFVLWKPAKEGEPEWDSPWGKGRPGWHIECSAMAINKLGPSIDIHGGGQDLIFPHHENELCQSECYTGKPFANIWMHNGFVTIDNEKMSKSDKNFFTIQDVLDRYPGEVLRFFLMKTHYRSPVSFSWDGLDEAKQALQRLTTALENHSDSPDATGDVAVELTTLEQRFYEAMDDDFNYTEAIGILFELSKKINSHGINSNLLRRLGMLLGLFYSKEDKSVDEEIVRLIEARTAAKQNKKFQEADDIRDQLLTIHHVQLEDTPDGVRWKKA